MIKNKEYSERNFFSLIGSSFKKYVDFQSQSTIEELMSFISFRYGILCAVAYCMYLAFYGEYSSLVTISMIAFIFLGFLFYFGTFFPMLAIEGRVSNTLNIHKAILVVFYSLLVDVGIVLFALILFSINWREKEQDTRVVLSQKMNLKDSFIYALNSIKISLTSKYFSMKGCATRLDFLAFQIFFIISFLILFYLVLDKLSEENAFYVLVIFLAILIVPFFTLWVRRLHDFNSSGHLIHFNIVLGNCFFIALTFIDLSLYTIFEILFVVAFSPIIILYFLSLFKASRVSKYRLD